MEIENYYFWILFAITAVLHVVEVFVSQRNARWLMKNGGTEFGKSHFKWGVLLLSLFLVGLPIESIIRKTHVASYWGTLLLFYILSQVLRFWGMISLGRYWTIRTIVIPGDIKIVNGPYRWMPHPIYIAAFVEILVLPLMMECYFTAFTVITGYTYWARTLVSEENKALTLLRTPS